MSVESDLAKIPQRAVWGTIYLLHFSKPLKHARHYLGWAEDLEVRLAQHRSGNGARITQVAIEAGITLELVRTWDGTRRLERKFKQTGSTRLCPICKVAYNKKHKLRMRAKRGRKVC